MSKLPWTYVTLILGLLASQVALVWVGKLDAEVITAFVSALTGGGLIHIGRTGTSTSGTESQ